jgi:hypothetical protein
VKLQPAAITPPLTAQLRVAGGSYKVPGPDAVNDTVVSPEFQPEPETVTAVPVGPEVLERDANGTPRLKLALTDGPGTTLDACVKITE